MSTNENDRYSKFNEDQNLFTNSLLSRNIHTPMVTTDKPRQKNCTVNQDGPRSTCCSQRWIMAHMGAWLGVVQFLLSMNMSVTVVCMVKDLSFVGNGSSIPQTEQIGDISEVNEGNPFYQKVHHNVSVDVALVHVSSNNMTLTMANHQTGEFTWTKKEQSYILSGYFYSYGLAQIPGGWLGAKYGGRRVIGISMTVACLMTLLTPLMARASLYLVVVARILLGLCLAVVFPAFCGLVGAWALPTERSRMFGWVCIGQTFGALLAYSTSGILCVHGFDNGWASVFYLHGILGVAFVTFWWYVVYNSPIEHPRITEAEMMMITNNSKHNMEGNKKKPPIPWKKIFTHLPLYIMYVAHTCDAWTFYLILTCLPQYLKEVLHFDIQSNGLLSCLPLVTSMVGNGIAGVAADFFIKRTKLNITTIRKLFLVSGFVGVGCFMIAPGFLTSENRNLAIMCICFCTLFLSLESVGGFCPNSEEIAPKYASIIFGISNTLASVPGAVAPLMVAIITKNQTVEEWRIVFFIAAGVSVFACIVYGLFANNEPVKWGSIHEDAELDVGVPINSVQSVDDKADMEI